MTKVEELRKMLIGCIGDYKRVHSQDTLDILVCGNIDSLIAAAEAQGEAKGRAEGAEQERKRIWDARLVGYSILTSPPIKQVNIPVDVFAPATKEEVKP